MKRGDQAAVMKSLFKKEQSKKTRNIFPDNCSSKFSSWNSNLTGLTFSGNPPKKWGMAVFYEKIS